MLLLKWKLLDMSQTVVMTLFAQKNRELPTTIPQFITSEKMQSAGYYYSNRDIQTVTWSMTDDFAGRLVIQASLHTNPVDDTDWFNVFINENTGPKNGFSNITGNYVWIRAKVTDWLTGSVRLVTVSY